MSGFTKGKWFLGSHQTKAGKHKKINVVASVSKRIATILGTDAEAKANARLIAKAPNMYRLLADFLNPEIAIDSTTYQALQEVAVDLLNNIDGEENAFD